MNIVPRVLYLELDANSMAFEKEKCIFKIQIISGKYKIAMFYSPVSFAVVLEVVHVTAGGRVQSIFSLPFLSPFDIQQVSMVLHHKLSFGEAPGCKHSPSFSSYVSHLFKWRTRLQLILKA